MKHLAELNIARFRHPAEDPRNADFMNNLDRINGIAERSPGFVWRLKDDSGNATAVRAFDDPLVIVNLTVWETAEALERFVWQTVHKQFYGRRPEWFEPMKGPHFVMWWVPVGHRPTLDEAKAKLERLAAHGDSDDAFGWEALPHVKLWRSVRCA
jgi:hypothetical protein